MTPAIAVAANVTPPSAPSVPASAGKSSPDGNSPSAFAAPLQQARQQQSAQRPSSSTSTASPSDAPASASSSAASTTTSAAASTTTGKSWHPAGDDAKDDSKPSKSTIAPTEVAAAMLALLGHSIPANAAPTPAVPANGAAEGAPATSAAVTATTLQVAGMPGLPMPVAAQASAQADADAAADSSKATDSLKDSALSALAGDAGDDTTTATATAPGADAKLVNAAQATAATPIQSDKSDPLEALRNLTTPFVQAQAPLQAAAPHAMTMNASVGTPSFAQELGQHVAWLGGQNIKEARITLHPEDLGQLDVKVSVQHDHVDVSFIAQHPNAVHAVQQTLSQLDSMLAHHGLTLGQAQVGQGNHGRGAGQGASPGSAATGDAVATDEGAVAQVAAPVVQALGLLDMFA